MRIISFQEEAMGAAYTEDQILQMCEDAFRNIPAFYNASCVNYCGNCKGTDKLYTEVIAAFLIERIDRWKNGFPKDFHFREKSYQTPGHHTNCHINPALVEDMIAKQLLLQCKNGSVLAHIGSVIDYQTPLRNTNKKNSSDSGPVTVGKIDALSVDHRTKTVYILELKKPGVSTPETMLRCVLEAYTYLQLVNKAKLLHDFGLPDDYAVKACPLVFYGDAQWQEMRKEPPMLKKLMQLLDSKPYYLSQKDGRFIVTED